MRKLLLIMTALVLSMGAQAQLLKAPIRKTSTPPPVAQVMERIGYHAKAAAAKKAITLGEGQMWWGYFSEDLAADLPFDGYLGLTSPATIDIGIHVPASHSIVGGAKISGLRFWLGEDVSAITSVRVWVSKTEPTSTSLADYVQIIPMPDLTGKLNEVQFTKPFVVDNSEIYAGITFTISGPAYPIMAAGDDAEGAFLFRADEDEWYDMYGGDYGKLAMQLLLDGLSLPENAATPSDFETSYAIQNGSGTVELEITNNGQQPITSISYTVTTDGGTTSLEYNETVDDIASGQTGYVYLNLDADATAKKHNKMITITKVNGQPNAAAQKTCNGVLITLAEQLPVTPVIEEFTGMWCGYCPAGIDGMKAAHETFGDQVILIAVHYGDVIACADYDPIIEAFADGFPSAIMDRQYSLYPMASTIQSYLKYQLLNRITVGAVTVNANWADEAKETINMNSNVQFAYSDEEDNYGVAYVLLADGLKGSGDDWRQRNYFSGDTDYSDMFPNWVSAADYVEGLEFNHVPVAAWGIENGANDVNAPIVQGELSLDFQGTIAGNTLIQDKTKLSVVALLIDKATGEIVNAAKTTISDAEPTPTGIAINEVNFPDDNFRAWLLNSENINGYGADALLTDDEIADILEINVNNKDISELKGIEYFTALQHLYASENKLTSVDLSKNTALFYLELNSNKLTAIDVSKNTDLYFIHLNNNNLTAIDVSKNTHLHYLELQNNNLTSIDVSENTNLLTLYLWHNNLTSIDVSKNTELYTLSCGNNQLTSIDLSENPALWQLDCSQNALTSIDVSTNPALRYLDCSGNALTSVIMSNNNTALEALHCSHNQLTSIDVSMLPKLSHFTCYENQISSLDVSKNPALEYLLCYHNQLTALDVSANTALYRLDIYDNNINETEMGKLVESMPTVTPSGDIEYGIFNVIDMVVEDNNVINTEQVAAAKAKNWKVQAILNEYGSSWKDYEGTAPDGIDTLITQPSRNQSIYNVAGQQQIALRRGINIVGGKKVLVK